MTIVFLKKKLFVRYINSRIKNNKNFLAMFVGATGSGKSYSALKLGEDCNEEILNKPFNINRVAFNSKRFLEILDKEKLTAGETIIWDEVGIGLSAREWQTICNRNINAVMQTFRQMRLIVLMTCPDVSFLDSQTRKLLHCLFVTQGIDYKEKEVKTKPLLIQNNPIKSEEPYKKYLRVVTKKYGVVPYVKHNFGLPRKELRDIYEEKRYKFVTRATIKKALEETNALEERNRIKDKKELTKKQRGVLELLDKGLLVPDVAKEIGIPKDTVYFHIQQARKKGIDVVPIKEGLKIIKYNVFGLKEEKGDYMG